MYKMMIIFVGTIESILWAKYSNKESEFQKESTISC